MKYLIMLLILPVIAAAQININNKADTDKLSAILDKDYYTLFLQHRRDLGFAAIFTL